jgi:hypothetical protein
MPVKDRVRRHRAKCQEAQCRRFEVTLGLGLINQVRELAKRKQVATWEIVEEALLAVTGNP